MVCLPQLLVFVTAFALSSGFPSERAEGEHQNAELTTVRLPEHARVLVPSLETGIDFSCTGRKFGFYADIRTECKVVHVCHPFTSIRGLLERRLFSFVCDDGTVFDQSTQTCSRAEIALPCFQSSQFYELTSTTQTWFSRLVLPIKTVLSPLNPFRKPVEESTEPVEGTGSSSETSPPVSANPPPTRSDAASASAPSRSSRPLVHLDSEESSISQSEASEPESQQSEFTAQQPDSESQQSDSESQQSDSESQLPVSESQQSDSESQQSDSESQQFDSESQQSDSESQQSDSESQQSDSESQQSDSESQLPASESHGSYSEPEQQYSDSENEVDETSTNEPSRSVALSLPDEVLADAQALKEKLEKKLEDVLSVQPLQMAGDIVNREKAELEEKLSQIKAALLKITEAPADEKTL